MSNVVTLHQASFSGKLEKTAPPRKPKNADVRSREHLTPGEVDKLMSASGKIGRHRARDKTLILMMYRHGLRVTELVTLRWDQIDLDAGLIHINRLKNGTPSTHPLGGTEIRALRKLKRDYPATQYVFITERKGPMTDSAVRKLMARAGREAGFDFPAHPHMLRHACGFKLANDGQDTRAIQHYLGHKNIQHTVRYTELAADRFKGFLGD
ncbi:MAG: tyrosine-type recombinase/integrase [gamma proteobacterium symbiont of Bathyaustriella thionipta]|nr:tyrosine-type recombinase/integrase [gamma proteobacterium symbiont of Bathyaustriella thionipta]